MGACNDEMRQRRMLMKLRGGTAELRIETGRWPWCRLRRDERDFMYSICVSSGFTC